MSQACTHARPHDRARTALAAEVARAQAACEAQGERWTPPRRRVYELLLAAGAPVKAYELMDRYEEGRTAKPPTVYRALEFLEAQGLVHRIASLNAYTACASGETFHDASFLICECCGSAEEIDVALSGPVVATSAARGFHPS